RVTLVIGLSLVSFVAAAHAAVPAACMTPTTMAATPEETAWRLFVASTCPVGTSYPYVAWEKWIEQNQLYQAQQAAPHLAEAKTIPGRFSPSVLASSRKKKGGGLKLESAATGCNSSPSIFGRILCEEVRINPDAQSYITTNSLQKRSGQAAFAQASKP